MRSGLLALALASGCSLVDAAGSGEAAADGGAGGGEDAGCQDEGCFAAVDNPTEVPSPTIAAVGRLHGDELPDVVVVDQTEGSLEVLENLDGGDLATTGTIAAGGVSRVAIGDFVEDPGNEVLMLDAADRRLVMVGITTENGGPYTVNTTDLDGDGALIAVGDFDGDQLDDVVLRYPSIAAGGLQLRLSRGDGLFEEAEPEGLLSPGLDGGPLLVADLDNDRNLDILCVQEGSFLVYRGRGDGSFDPELAVGTFAGSILGAGLFDLTDDQLPELVLAVGGGTSRFYVVENESDDGLGADSFVSLIEDLEMVSESVADADFDGDGLRDVVAFNAERTGDLPDATILRSLVGGGFDTNVWVFMDDPIGAGAVGDLDGDGLTDLVAPVPGRSLVRVYFSRLRPVR